MNAAINLKATELKATEIIYPNFKSRPTATEIKVMPFVNTHNVLVRNCKANAYRAECKRKDKWKKELQEIVGLLGVVTFILGIFATYFIFC